MTFYDYAILAFYFVYLLVISWVFRRFVHNISDYFRSGGQVIWWMAGGSAFIVSFSAWTFTGAAGRAYGDGWPIAMIYVGNTVGFVASAWYFAPRFRQLRVITSMQAVRARFGAVNEQFFMWLTLPLRVMYAGIWLYGLGVFFSTAFSMDLTLTILLAGGTVTAISLLGGSWAVVASDFIQVLILMPVTVVAMVLAVTRLGGAGAFVHQLSATRLNFGKLFTDDFLLFWCLAMCAKQFFAINSLTEAPRYFCVKDSRHARKAAVLAGVLMLAGVVIWFVPPMAASVTHPDLARLYPGLRHPSEGSYFAMAIATFPVGLLGLLVSGVFAATMSAMDTGLNSNAGIFIKNFYQPSLRPDATERELLLAGKITTLGFGVLIVSLAQAYSHLLPVSLYELMLDFGILVALPLSLPLVLGIFIRRTPAWSGWSTVLVVFATGVLARYWLTVGWAVRTFGAHPHPNVWERENWDQAIGVCLNVAAGVGWFCFTRFFYRYESDGYKSAVDAFSRQIDRPVDYDREETAVATDDRQSWVIGWLCLPYGALICLLAFIPNPASGRLAFIFCGVVLLLIGLALIRQSRVRPASASGPKIGALVAALTAQEIADFLPEPLWAELRGLAPEFRLLDPAVLSAADFQRELAAADPEVLVACWKTASLPVPLPPRLKYVCYLTGSIKKLITRSQIERGLLVTNWGGSVSRVVAECALMLTVAALRRGGHWIPAMRRPGTWKSSRVETASLFGRRVGLHGFGSIARELTRLLQPFGVSIEICAPETDPALYAAHGARREASLENLFAQNDVIIELAPLIPETTGLVTERLLRRIRPGGVFVNVGRGAVVDEAALARVAREGAIQVALDVYGTEPLPDDSPLRGLANVILLPHLSGPTTDRCRDAGAFALRNLRAYAGNRPLESVITPEIFDITT